MDCYVGATTGALKGALLKDNTFENLNEIKSLDPKSDEITSMIWNDDQQTEILIARMNRDLQLFDIEQGEQVSILTVSAGTGPVKGLHKSDEKIVTCVESGEIQVWNDKSEVISEWKCGPGAAVMRGSNEKPEIVTGGMKNLLKTWNLETGQQIWSSRNVPPDMLGLEIPIMVTDARFIPGQHTILEANKHHEMRLYDPRAQRRPVKRIPFMENPIMCTSLTYRTNQILAANSIGEMGLFDLRSKIHPMCKFKGQSGSIRGIDGHPTQPLAASVGIDRFLRVHDLQSRKLIHKIYCKTRLNRVLLRDELSILNEKKSGAKKEIDEDETDYGNMTEDGYRPADSEDDDVIEEDDVWGSMDKVKKGGKKTDDVEILEEVKGTRKRRESVKEEVMEEEAPKKKILKKKKKN
uniref:WD_REPEATS_REGION domain-containing protein n=1 Tax=Caenorhabditis tropicalis TaxID=1561998 RepID=A0A1I7V2N9_9PELO